MFSKEVVTTRHFLELPASARALYYQLGVEADDDGFVDPYMTMLATKSTDIDLNLLMVKKLLIRFPSGVVVVTNWKQNNFLRSDRYKQTVYLEEKEFLKELPNRAYSLGDTSGQPVGIPNDNHWSTQYRIEESSIEKEREPEQVPPARYGSWNSITDEIAGELAGKYGVTKTYVLQCKDSAENWCKAKGKRMKDYKAFLSNWVQRQKASDEEKARKFNRPVPSKISYSPPEGMSYAADGTLRRKDGV